MEFIEGDTLDYKRWKTLGEEACTKICSKLSDQLHLLRSVPSEGYYGRVYNQGWRHRLCLLRGRANKMCGPYNTYENCVSGMYTASELQESMWHDGKDLTTEAELALSNFKRTLTTGKGHEPTLTHLDPSLQNIIVRPLQGTEGPESDWEVTLIDWADLGWLPGWMQAVAFSQQVVMFHGWEEPDEHAKIQFWKE